MHMSQLQGQAMKIVEIVGIDDKWIVVLVLVQKWGLCLPPVEMLVVVLHWVGLHWVERIGDKFLVGLHIVLVEDLISLFSLMMVPDWRIWIKIVLISCWWTRWKIFEFSI